MENAQIKMGKKKVILVVDDDSDLNDLMCNALGDAGYDTVSAYDGMQGVDLAREYRPDLVLLDVMMPKMDGIEACRTIAKDESTSAIPVIMVTVKGGLTPKLSSYMAGARRYLTKPIEMDDLLAEVDKVLK